MRKSLAISIAFLVLLASTVSLAASSLSRYGMDGTFTADVRSQYILVHGFIGHHGAVSQSDIYLDMGHGLYADVWVSQPLGGKQDDGGKEIDYQVGYTQGILDGGLLLFDTYPTFTMRDNVLYPYLKVGRRANLGSWSLYPYLELDYLHSLDDAANDGVLVQGNLDYGYRRGWLNHSGKLHLIHDGGVFHSKQGFVLTAEFNCRWQAGPATLRVPIVKLSMPAVSDRSFQSMVGCGISFDI